MANQDPKARDGQWLTDRYLQQQQTMSLDADQLSRPRTPLIRHNRETLAGVSLDRQ